MNFYKRKTTKNFVQKNKRIYSLSNESFSETIIAKRGKNQYLYDFDGNRYIDLFLNDGKIITGHSNKRITHYVKNAMSLGTAFGVPAKSEYLLAKKLYDSIPNCEKAIFFESEYLAYKKVIDFSKMVSGKTKCVIIGEKRFSDIKDIEEIPINEYKNISKSNDVGCIIVEPFSTLDGSLENNIEMLRELKKIAKEISAILVCDEINTAFRLSFGTSANFYNIDCDVSILGSSITAGFPFSAIIGKKEIIQEFSKIHLSESYRPISPVILSSGLATLKILRETNFYNKGEFLLNNLRKKLSRFLKIKVNKTCFSIELNQKKDTFTKDCLDNGIFLLPNDSKICYISVCHNENDIKQIFKQFKKLIIGE